MRALQGGHLESSRFTTGARSGTGHRTRHNTHSRAMIPSSAVSGTRSRPDMVYCPHNKMTLSCKDLDSEDQEILFLSPSNLQGLRQTVARPWVRAAD